MTGREAFLLSALFLAASVVLAIFMKTFIIISLFFAWVLLFCALLYKYIHFSKRVLIAFFAGALVGNIFIFVFTYFQDFIPFWDYAGYWQETVKNSKLFYESLPDWANSLYSSMLHSDYTRVPVQFFAPIIKAFGGEYNLYIFCIYNMYILPFLLLFFCLLERIGKKAISGATWTLVVFFAPILTPALYGYLDSIGLMFIAALLIISYEHNFYKFSFFYNLLFSVFLVLFIFTRRWYMFFIVSLFLAAGIMCVIRIITSRQTRRREGVYVLNLLCIAAMTIGITAAFFMPYLSRLFTNRFADTYSAYQFGDFVWNINYFISYYGYVPFALSVFGFLRGVRYWPTRRFTQILGLCYVFSFVLFTHMQTISYHHQYIFVPMTLLFLSFVIILPYKSKLIKRLFTGLCTCVVLTSFALTYVPALQPAATAMTPLFSAKQMYPKVNENTEVVLQIADYLNELTEGTGDHAYIFSSSEIFNDDMLQNSAMPEKSIAVESLFSTAHVDKNDGFPNVALVAKYVLVADPVQLHLNGEGQEIVSYLAEQITAGKAKNLVPIKKFYLKPGITVTVYERVRGYELSFLKDVKSHFEKLYPGYKKLTNIDMVYSQND